MIKGKILILIIICSINLRGQEANLTWKGNKAYRARNYDEAQQSYERSLSISPTNTAAFNLANSMYRQKKYQDAARIYQSIAEKSQDKSEKAQAYHNLGNAMMRSNQLDQGINAYKNALRNDPNDAETRYNLSYALSLKKQEEDQQKQDQDKKQDQNKEDQKDQNQDQNKDEQQKEDQQKDQQNQEKNEQKQEQDQQQQPRPNEISKEDAQRLLDNLENDEEKTKEKVQLMKKNTKDVKIENDW